MPFRFTRLVETLFLPIAICFSTAALVEPALFLWLKPHIPQALGIIMFGMGLTLTPADFAAVWPRRRLVLLGVSLQYTAMPLTALLVGRVFHLPPEAALGLLVVGACPGGTASNVITYLARGDVALSVTLTLVSTMLAPLLTPAVVYLFYNAQMDIALWPMVKSVFWIVVFPLVDGLVIRRLLRKRVEPLTRVFPSVSILAIAAVIACVTALNRETILEFPALLIAAVVCHNLAGFSFGYLGGTLLGCERRDAVTLSIEVGMQNSGLGVALAHKFFSAAAALPGAIFSLEQNLVGVALARRWSKGAPPAA